MKIPLRLLSLLSLAALALPGRAAVVINEIMYHPASELTTEEYIELYNTGAAAVDVSGWKITSGVRYTFPAGTVIGAGAYVVVTANPAVFHAKYPAVANYVPSSVVSGYIASSGWQTVVAGLVQPNGGILSNSADHIVLVNAAGAPINDVNYADDGDWGVLRKDFSVDVNHRGWNWDSAADGAVVAPDTFVKSKSMELMNANFPNSSGQTWAPSVPVGGSPGAVNSVAAADIAPVITRVAHFPLVPLPTDAVTITANVVNDDASVPVVTLHWRVCATALATPPFTENDPAFAAAAMFDDGAHGDALAGDGVYGVTLPAQANGAIVEFYFDAKDGANHTRVWPAPSLAADAVTLTQTNNCLYQVDSTIYPGAQPLYRLVMRPADKAELVYINATAADAASHAKFDTTWITEDGTSSELNYLALTRNRGHGSASKQPEGLNVAFANDNLWKKITSLNLNSQQTHAQLFGSALYRKAGLAGPESRGVQVRWNNANPAAAGGSPSFGFYCANEVENSDFSNHHFPNDSSGNIYRSQRLDSNLQQGDFSYIDNNPVSYQPVWFKHTNSSENDWTDLIGLCLAFTKGHSDAAFTTTYDAGYEAGITARVDVAEWMHFFAVQTIVDNSETNISNGYGDDFYIYFGVTDPRCRLTPYDLDTICGQGDSVPTPTQHGLFRMVNKDDAAANGPTVMNSFMKNPTFAPIYYDELNKQLNGAFTAPNFNALVDEVLTGVVPAAQITSIKTFQTARTPYVASLVPLAISVTNKQTVAGAALPAEGGYTVSVASRASTSPASVVNADPAHCKLIGKANAIKTRSVKVNGVPAVWSPWQATWTAASVTLTPGINKILIQAFDGSVIPVETERFTQDIWYDDASVASASGAISVNTVWTAAAGPYSVTANLTVNSGVTLTIQPGTTVYLASGVNIIVASGGKILAEGTDTQRIRFTRAPGAATSWGSLQVNGAAGSPETRIAYADFEFNGGNPCILCTGATVYLDHLTFGNTAVSYIHLDGSSFIVSNCIFPDATAQFEAVHGTGGVKAGGYGIIRGCYFGLPIGYNDVVDFTGGSRPGTALIQFYNNVCNGASDDMLDLDGTDAWVEGNIFLHSHKNGSPDTSSAVSGGQDQGIPANKSEITIIGNIFYDCDGAMTAKEGNFFTLINNTIVHQSRIGGTELRAGVVNLADDGIAQGVGTYLEGNIIYDIEALERSYSPPLTSVVTFNNNILPFAWNGPGSGNSIVDPRFKYVPAVSETNFASFQAAQVMRDWFSLLPGSPAIGTGPNGRDKGAVTTRGASIGGAPTGTTNLTTATLTVGSNATGFSIPTTPWPNGSGFTHYQWKLDAGAFSAERTIGTPIVLTGLANGAHTVSVIGKNDVGTYQNDTKLGTDATVTTATWTVDTNYVPPPLPTVIINEVLAKNSETVNFGTALPDIIELRNAGGATVVLDGWGLTDNAALPFKYTFPTGTSLAPGAYLVIYADNAAAVPALKTGFGLKQSGDTLTLTKLGGLIADSVSFGAQLPDYSVGRRPSDGQWDMCVPTFGSANVVAAQGKPARLLINEWLADAKVLVSTDFIELYNPSPLPVNIGACYLTDNPVDNITVSPLRQLTFIAAGGYASFKADGDTTQGPDHLAFKLSPLEGEIGFFDSAQNVIDRIIYGPQSTDVSQGRSPNGALTLAFFNQPTPGGPNPGSSGGGGSAVVPLITATQSWKYFSSATDPGALLTDGSGRFWNDKAFTDTSWVSRAQLLYIENAALTNTESFVKEAANPNYNIFAADGTTLLGFNATHPWQTYYFRTHFTYSGALAGVSLTLKTMLDDGCILYLNGTEVMPTAPVAGRIGMAAGAVAWGTLASRNAADAVVETFTLPATLLVVGDNVLAVEVHQSGTQTAAAGSTDIVWGAKLDANVPGSSTAAIVLNEVLANNATLTDPDGSLFGWIELYNSSGSAVDVSDMSLTTSTGDAREWVFPAGSSVPATGYLVVFCNPLLAPSATVAANMNTGFGLSPVGDHVFLFQKLADGGGLQDGVNFGQQVPDRSIGRITNGTGAFTLNTVTRGASNTAAALGAISTVKVNEWLALPPAGASWLELYNSGASPVLLSGYFLTDNLTNKTKFPVGPLTFIAGTGNLGNSRWLQLIADNDSGATPNHVNFTLNPAGEALGIFSAAGVQLESVSFGSQTAGISGGRLADGTATITALNPTPGAANQPLSQDTDLDGIPDWWERLHGFNPNFAGDATLDTDGDGQSNKAEYLAGTDPRNASDTLRASITTTTPGQFRIQFIALPGHAYTIQYKNALTDAAWTTITQIAAPPSVPQAVDYPDMTVGANAKRFYHVVTPQQP